MSLKKASEVKDMPKSSRNVASYADVIIKKVESIVTRLSSVDAGLERDPEEEREELAKVHDTSVLSRFSDVVSRLETAEFILDKIEVKLGFE